MIDIRIEGESLDLFPDTAYTLERYSPLFDFETIQGTRVYPFSVPSTPRNRTILGYFYLMQIGYEPRRYRCEKYVFGQLIEQGYAVINQVDEKGFAIYYTQNLGDIFGDRQNVKLSDMLDLGSEATAASPLANPDLTNAQTRLFYPTIINPNFYGNTPPSGFGGRMNDYNTGTSQYATNGRVPMVLLKWLLERFGTLASLQFGGAWVNDASMKRLLLYNQFALDGASTITYANHLPDWTMRDMLMNYRRLFNLYLDFDSWNRTLTIDYGRDVLDSQAIDDWTEFAVPTRTKQPDPASRLDLGFDIDQNDLLMKPLPTAFDRYVSAGAVGVTAQVIRSGFSTLNTDTGTGLASTLQAGVSGLNKDSNQKSIPKVLFWKGLVGGLPTATNEHGTTRLAWSGTNNLVDGYWKNFETMKATTFSLKQGVFLSPANLARFSFRRKVHIRGVNYMVGSLRAGISMTKETVPVEVDLWRV